MVLNTPLRLSKILKSIWNVWIPKFWRKLCISSMLILQRISLRRDIPRYRFAHVLVNSRSKKFCKIHRNAPATEFLFNLQPATLLKKKHRHIYFLLILQNFLGALLLWKTSYKLVLTGECYEKWRTDILIVIKRYREVAISFKEQILWRKV